MGLIVALTMLLGTVQLVARLHRTSVVGAVATDAVHRVAEAPSATAAGQARRVAETRIRALLGDDAEIRWSEDDHGPAIEVVVPSPRLPGLPGDIRRGAQTRTEQPA